MKVTKTQIESFTEALLSSHQQTPDFHKLDDDILADPSFSRDVMAEIRKITEPTDAPERFELLMTSILERALFACAPCAVAILAVALLIEGAPQFAEAYILWSSIAPL